MAVIADVRMSGHWYGLPPLVGLAAVCLGCVLFGVWVGLWWGARGR